MAYDARLTCDVLNVFIRALFGELRRRPHELRSLRASQCGAVTFVQRYGDALNANVHFHCLVIDGVYAAGEDGRPEFYQLLASMMFLLMVRVTNPVMPRTIFGVLNTRLFFPSGAVYPQQAFPPWMQAIATVDPFTYIVHALKTLMLKNTTFRAISFDLIYLAVFTAAAMTAATLLYRRTL